MSSKQKAGEIPEHKVSVKVAPAAGDPSWRDGNADALEDIHAKTAKEVNAKYDKRDLENLARTVGIDAIGLAKAEIIRQLQAHMDTESGAEVALDADAFGREIKETDAEGGRVGIRCPRCGGIAIEFRPGYSPSRDAGRTAFHRQPWKFVVPIGQSEVAVQAGSREHPTCPRCQKTFGVYGGTHVRPRFYVDLDV